MLRPFIVKVSVLGYHPLLYNHAHSHSSRSNNRHSHKHSNEERVTELLHYYARSINGGGAAGDLYPRRGGDTAEGGDKPLSASQLYYEGVLLTRDDFRYCPLSSRYPERRQPNDAREMSIHQVHPLL